MSGRRGNQLSAVDQLGLFDYQVDQLGQRRLVADGLRNSFNISWDQAQGLQVTVTQHDEEDLRSFLVDFRKFVLRKEATNLDRIYNLCETAVTSDDLRQRLRRSREVWKDAQRGSGIRIVFNERDLTPTHVMDLWLNGYYFHNDDGKLAELRSIWPYEIARFRFMNFLVDATRQVFYVGSVVRLALREGMVAP